MPRPLNEQVVVITGASSGIGRAAALKFGETGAAVVLAARNELELNRVADDIRHMGGRALAVATDVSSWDQVRRLAEDAVSTFGRIDTWVNNAAVMEYASVEDTTVDEIERLIDVNLLGQLFGIKAVLPYMLRQAGGTIINVVSAEAVRALPYQSVYAASKHGVKGFSEALRMEMKRQKTGVDVTLILPASVNTPLYNHARSKLGVKPAPVPPVYRPELVADAIIAAAQRPQRSIYVGGAGAALRTLNAISPYLTDRLMLLGGSMFKLQQSNEPDDGRDNLFQPSAGPGRVEGDFSARTKPSLYTRFVALRPRWTRVLISAFAAGVAIVLRKR